MAILERLLLVLDLKLCLVQVSWSAPRFLCGVRSNGVVTGYNWMYWLAVLIGFISFCCDMALGWHFSECVICSVVARLGSIGAAWQYR
uniref:AlNc14C175G8113 protein n=1 Tax=Albugo laibachii Nc14 TaxID=890382 RepID=F0WNV8_9STRA|nr:AlNc14C175G8113 [Albugo laibachii Nc14]|eukprot:CCA23001.1 AlNc14C175G8113 [Albugo laibachii Nc14]